jgi:hypothetical protein
MLLSLIYFLTVVAGYGLDFFLPPSAKRLSGIHKVELGWLSDSTRSRFQS